jgi:hypothetical protein
MSQHWMAKESNQFMLHEGRKTEKKERRRRRRMCWIIVSIAPDHQSNFCSKKKYKYKKKKKISRKIQTCFFSFI